MEKPVFRERRTPILLGESGAQVVRVQRLDGTSWIEKSGPAEEIAKEAVILHWCVATLPVPRVLEESAGRVCMTDLPGVPLHQVPVELAASILADTLQIIHAVPFADCPLPASWEVRLLEAQKRLQAGLIDESDFDEANQGRSAAAILEQLQAFPPLPPPRCFTHGDATLENFLTGDGRLSGIVDLGRAGVTHPAQDWALALRSMRGVFGVEGDRLFRRYIPADSATEALLNRFCLLNELF